MSVLSQLGKAPRRRVRRVSNRGGRSAAARPDGGRRQAPRGGIVRVAPRPAAPRRVVRRNRQVAKRFVAKRNAQQTARRKARHRGGRSAASRPDAGVRNPSRSAFLRTKDDPRELVREATRGRLIKHYKPALRNISPFHREIWKDDKGNVIARSTDIAPEKRVERFRRTGEILPKSHIPRQGGFGADPERDPVIKGANRVLQETLRPVHGQMGAAEALLKGKNPAKAWKKGAIDNERKSFKDVLKAAGVENETVLNVGGLGGDILLDPVTYLTVGKNLPQKLGSKAVTRGSGGGRVGFRATVPFTDKGFDRGVAVRTPKHVKKAATKVRESRPVQGLGETFAHDFRPKHRTPETHETIRTAQRRYRASAGAAERGALRRKQAIEREFTDKRTVRQKVTRKKPAVRTNEQRAVIDAIEGGTAHELPERLQRVAKTLQRQFGEEFAAKKKAGLLPAPLKPQNADDAVDYFPHISRKEFEDPRLERKAEGVTRPAAEKGRLIRKRLSVLREESPDLFEDDLARIAARSRQKTGKKIALHEFWQTIAKGARKPEPGKELRLAEGEQLYEMTPRGPKLLDDSDRQKFVDGKREGDHFVMREDDVRDIDRRLAGVGPNRTKVGRVFDKAQGKWKWLVTVPNPSYHGRNYYGDHLNAYLADTTAKSMAQSHRAVKVQRAKSKAEKSFDPKAQQEYERLAARPLKVGDETSTYGRELELAEKEGAIKTGQISAELRELGARHGAVSRASEYREDLARFATYLSARKRGMKPPEAAEWSLKHHFDYSDLTAAEEQFRRLIPFWTFAARNTRLQAGKVLTRPGKIATQAKVFDFAARQAGYEDYNAYLADKEEYQQRGLPLPVKVGGKVYNVYVYPTSTDLQQVATLSPTEQVQNALQRATALKAFVELALNKSFFTREDIESYNGQLVPAPDMVGGLPSWPRKRLGIEKYYDARSGKQIWGWPPKTDHVARQLPQTNLATQGLTSIKGSRGMTAGQQAAGWLTGVKVAENDPVTNRVNRLYDRASELKDLKKAREKQLKKIRPRNKDGSPSARLVYPPDKRRDKIKAELSKVEQEIGKLRTQRGDAPQNIAPQMLPKKKVRRQSGGGDPYNFGGGGGAKDPYDF